MRNFKKKIVSAALALVLAATTIAPVTVEAATVSDEQTIYLTSKSGNGYASIYVGGLGKNEEIKSVKSNKSSVVKPNSVNTHYYDRESTYENLISSVFNSKDTYSEKYAYIGCELVKTGKATVSFKVYNSKTKKSTSKRSKITVKAYENPAKTVNIAGIKDGKSTNLAKKTKSQNSATLKLKSKATNAKVYVKPNSGWKITSASVYNGSTGNSYSISNYSKPLSSVSFNNVGTMKKDSYSRVTVDYINTKNGATMYTYYYINN